MPNSSYFDFLFLLLYTDRSKHIPMYIISSLMIGIFASVMFVSESIQKDIYHTLDEQADLTLQRYVAGKALNTPLSWAEEFRSIRGVERVTPRVYGVHYYEPNEQHFMIVGIDFQDPAILTSMQTLFEKIDIDEFFARDNMIIGHGVKTFLDHYHYFDYYIFRPPDRSKVKVNIYDTFPKGSSIVSNDMIFMDIDLARKILGVDAAHSTDIVLKVPNPEEYETVKNKLIITHFDMRIIQKEDIRQHYQNLFDYKGGVFIILYLITSITLLLIVYQRYSMISQDDIKEIALLRSVGWKITNIITLKMSETFIIALLAYLSGIIFAYGYVFFADAPLLKIIFFGASNLPHDITLTPTIDGGVLSMIFLIYIVPVLTAVVVPVWQISIIDPAEVMS